MKGKGRQGVKAETTLIRTSPAHSICMHAGVLKQHLTSLPDTACSANTGSRFKRWEGVPAFQVCVDKLEVPWRRLKHEAEHIIGIQISL